MTALMINLTSFFLLLNVEHPDLAQVRQHLEAGDETAALEAWRDQALVRLRETKLKNFNWHEMRNDLRQADWLIGRISDEEYGEIINQPGLKDVFKVAGPPGQGSRADWIAFPDAEGDKRGKVEYSQFEFAIPLVAAFQQTGDPVYLEKWFELTADFAQNQKKQMQTLSRAERLGYIASWEIRAGSLLTQGWRAANIVRSMAALAKTLDEGNRDRPWEEALEPVTAPLKPEAADLIPADQMAVIVKSLIEDHPDALIEAYLEPGNVPNQRLHGFSGLILIAQLFPEFERSPYIEKAAAKGYSNFLEDSFLKDGGGLEQSMNYNTGLVKAGKDLRGLYAEPRPEWVRNLLEAVKKRQRLFASIVMPSGTHPITGTSSYSDIDHVQSLVDMSDPLQARIIAAVKGEDVEPPAFRSIAFPYSGYYVMRNGWTPGSHYLWFLGPRIGRGHFTESVGGVQMEAFGRRLIVEGGSPIYNIQLAHPDDYDDYDAFRKYLGSDSALKVNTVLVDGLGQRRHDLKANVWAYQTPIPMRWHTSDRFDFAETVYADGFGFIKHGPSADPDRDPIPGAHRRQVLYLKDLGIWLLVDQLSVEGERTFTQVWNLPPDTQPDGSPGDGFHKQDVAVDENGFSTTDAGRPNVALHHFTTRPLEYEVFYGDREPHRGWYSYGITARKVPAPDIHASWTDAESTRLLTVIAPSATEEPRINNPVDHSEEGQPAAELALDGAKLWAATSESAAPMKAGAFEAEAKLLVVVLKDGAWSGIALGAQKLEGPDGPLEIVAEDFEFSLSGGEWQTLPIREPQTFQWEESEEGVVPRYFE